MRSTLQALVPALLALAAVQPPAAAAQRGSGCPTYLEVSRSPAADSYTATAGFTVKYGEDTWTVEGCREAGPIDESTFRFVLNGQDVTSQFTVYADSAVANALAMVDEATNTYTATIDGWDAAANAVTNSWTASTYVDLTPRPDVSTFYNNFLNQRPDLCAAACFSVEQRLSTAHYVSLDEPRSVSLVYRHDRVDPRPIVFVDVTHPGAAVATPQAFWLEATLNGVPITFLNGDQRLRFTGSRAVVRLAGQFDASAYTTGVYTLQLVVTAVYASSTQPTTVTVKLPIVNEKQSPVARGWSIGGLQRLHIQPDGSLLLVDGQGGVLYYEKQCSTCTPEFRTPQGEVSTITRTGTGTSTVYTRKFADSTKFQFNSVGWMTSFTNRLGDVVSYQYDGSGRLIQITDPFRDYAGNPTYVTLGYGTYGLATIREPAKTGQPNVGRLTRVTVGPGDSLLRAFIDPDGDSTRFVWESGTRRLSYSYNRSGAVTSYSYHGTTNKLAGVSLPQIQVDAGGGSTSSASPTVLYQPWQTAGLPQTSTSSTLAIAVPRDSIRGSVTDADGRTTSFTVNEYGQPTQIRDPALRTTYVQYWGNIGPRPSSIVYPDGSQDAFSYNGDGKLTGWSRSGDASISIQYGAYAQPQIIRRDGTETQYAFLGLRGRVDSVRINGGAANIIRYTYDSRGRLLTERDPENHYTYYHYDAAFGNLDSLRVAGNRTMRVRFDRFGLDSAVQVSGDPWRLSIRDELNRVREYYDGVNTNPTRYTFDKNFLTRVQDPAGQVYRFERNALGWTTREYDPADTLTRYVSFRYSAGGQLTSQSNRRGQQLGFTYDVLGRQLTKVGAGAVADSFSYSTNGRVMAAWNAVARDSIFTTDRWTDSVVTRIAGRRFRQHYVRHYAARLLASRNVTNDAGITFATQSFDYSGSLQLLLATYVNGQATQTVRNSDLVGIQFTWPSGIYRTDELTELHGPFRQSYSNAGVNAVLWRGYGYDASNRVAESIAISPFGQYRATQFRYDGLGRLSSSYTADFATCPTPSTDSGFDCAPDNATPTRSYAYDPVGNQTGFTTSTYLAGNRIQTTNWVSYEHDLDGNLTRKYDNDNGPMNQYYYWSNESRLDSVSMNGTRLRFEYNAFGQLVRKSRNGVVERHFLWDRDQLLAELDATATGRVAEYAYSLQLDRPVAIVTGATTIAATRYFAQDAIGNVTGVVNGASVDQSILYSVGDWGDHLATGTLADTNRLRWKSSIWDGDVKLYYMRSRWYDPHNFSGRFISEDPIGLAGGVNKYVFGGDDPVNMIDSYGTCPYVYTNSDEPNKVYQARTGDKIDYKDRTWECGCDGRWYAGGQGAPTQCGLQLGERTSPVSNSNTDNSGSSASPADNTKVRPRPVPIILPVQYVDSGDPEFPYDCTVEQTIAASLSGAKKGAGTALAKTTWDNFQRGKAGRSMPIPRAEGPRKPYVSTVAKGAAFGALLGPAMCVMKGMSQ